MISIEVKVKRHQEWLSDIPYHVQSTKFKVLWITLFERQKLIYNYGFSEEHYEASDREF
ncbi:MULTISPECIES: hypothetical protein [Pseudoalteromonas]|uniref:hypothetical protein n=1 Tax=Pseudoalteromonas TaxID=53246 RepID=UPI001EF4A977|nr:MULTISPECIES: hypothetical protein [Pseudoalteromonas]MCG7553088.1 hypothetical protein [Pseudoalteromonas sp. Of11M-6]MDW7548182.1 hypothetical protein [Pseudoalteromonas peptidolytica]